MTKALQWIILLAAFMVSFSLSAQQKMSSLEETYQEAERYAKVSLYGECLASLNGLIKEAEKQGNREYEIKASILKAEVFRKTRKFKRSTDILKGLENTREFPKLHVKKLGRLAATYREDGSVSEGVKNDTVLKIINEGIELAKQYELIEEEASLRNELGLMQAEAQEFEEADINLKRAAELFRKISDTENEMWAVRNILASLIWQKRIDEFNEMYPDAVEKVKDTEWYQLQSGIYVLIGNVERAHGDPIVGWQWHGKANQATVDYYTNMNTEQMAAFTTIHDTERFKKESLKKQAELDRQQYQLNQYIFFSIILLLIIALALVVLVRERRLKKDLNKNVKDLNVMNDKYEMLIVESNHRIKNNLQMIISMLEFTKKGIEHSRTDIIQSISGKIQTISTLHKHLYVDTHNEYVALNFYFNELVDQYRQMEITHTIEVQIEDIEIRSERIVYFGLILNEMLSNSIEHSNNAEKPISIKVISSGNGWLFEYCDNSKHETTTRSGTGLQLIQGLVRRVGGKEYLLDRENGRYQFRFETKSSKTVMAS